MIKKYQLSKIFSPKKTSFQILRTQSTRFSKESEKTWISIFFPVKKNVVIDRDKSRKWVYYSLLYWGYPGTSQGPTDQERYAHYSWWKFRSKKSWIIKIFLQIENKLQWNKEWFILFFEFFSFILIIIIVI